jgi:3-hydroxyacyl-CoA dehydrogenase/enoyl-CoA hydratase/3-hydroxybutyryl-CoA epimerase
LGRARPSACHRSQRHRGAFDIWSFAAFVELCKWLESSCGVRFASKLLIDMAEKGDTFYGRFAGQRAAA